MFLWMRDKKWLPLLSVAGICLFFLGGLDLLIQGVPTLIATVLLVASVAISRAYPWIAIGLSAVGLVVSPALGLDPQLAQLSASVTLLIVAVFANSTQRLVSFGVNVVFSAAGFMWQIFSNPDHIAIYSVLIPSFEAKLLLAGAGIITIVAINANAWFLGRLIDTRLNHVGTSVDLALLESEIKNLQFALAEQDKRFGIAKDVSEILLEQTSANLVAAESGGYALKSNPAIGDRILETLTKGIKESFKELRRLSDLLSLQDKKSTTLPGLRDLNALYVSYREKGFQVNVRETGEALNLTDGAALVIYRVVADS
ncbi:MAG: hypothetical protein EBR26_06595, partial [Microbacteriaceae bacterium]|nr:hypothetical protein [Microbacteriaceae bacterium]